MNKTESRLGTRFKTISMHMTHMYIVPPKPYEERTSRVGGKMKIRLKKPALNNFKAYGWQK